MKKSLFGFSAKIAMAVLAVCSVVLTSCYQKPEPKVDEDPVYYVTGTVYDATTSAVIAADVTVNGKAVTVTGGSFLQEIDGPGAVTVAAEAEGYVSVSRTVQVVKVGMNQVSITTADIAMVPVGTEVPENSCVEANMTAQDLIAKFNFPANTEIGEDGLIHVHVDYPLESHDGHSMAHTKLPYVVNVEVPFGFIWDFEAEDPIVEYNMEVAASVNMDSYLCGSKYEEFVSFPFEETVNESGEKCLLSITICHTFSQWALTYVYDGVPYVANLVMAEDTVVMPEYDGHDNHDSHDNHGGNDSHDSHDSHDGHDNHGGTNAGGGAGDEE